MARRLPRVAVAAMKVVVIGAGVVGMCCAYELRRGGAEVVVVERGTAGQGASRGNTGWVSPSFTYPLPAPGVMREGLRGLVRGGGPLAIRPTLDPTFARWLLAFRRSCSPDRWERGVRALMTLNQRTLELFDKYAASGVTFEMHRSGLLLVATGLDGLASYRSLFAELRRLGFAGAITDVGADEARSLEPSLAASRLVGGVHATVDRYVRPETLTAGLARWLAERGVTVREGVAVTGVASDGEHVILTTAAGRLEADAAVVCAGAASARLLSALGVGMPLVGARGYSVTIAGGATRPARALYLAEAKVGISAYQDAVRIAGVFELGQARADLDRRRLAAMLASVEPYFETWRPRAEAAALEWAGLRPMTADGLPLIGRSPKLRNVYVATGHGMLGVTLAPATGAALAPLVLDGYEPPELLPFAPGRRA